MACTVKAIDLAQFTGSEEMHRYKLTPGILYTDGCQYLGNNGASWVVTDTLAQLAYNKKLRAEDFVAITYTVDRKKGSAKAVYTDGNEKILEVQEYPITDLSVDEIKFFCTNGVLMLASEY
jgi:hypothetical protein